MIKDDLKRKSNVYIIATVGIALALCLLAQAFKGIQFVTGPLVNTVLIITGLYVGMIPGVIVAVLSPVMAYIFAPAPVMQALPQMISVIMLGNSVIVMVTCLLKRKIILGLSIAAISKSLVMWLLSSFVIIPLFGDALRAPMIEAIRVTFSINQLVTSVIGAIIAYPVWQLMQNAGLTFND